MNELNSKFDDIRPYDDFEVPVVIDELIADPDLEKFITSLFRNFDYQFFITELKKVVTIFQFQSIFASAAVRSIVRNSIQNLTFSGIDKLDKNNQYLFITNHRDIILDSSLMNLLLFEHGFNTTQTAIGDNLYVTPLVTRLLRLNKSFTVKRNIQPRAFYEYSQLLSEYINYVLHQRKESVWIAQREGRAKDGNEQTQLGLLKMLFMFHKDSMQEALSTLNIIPVSISYEYDPCDVMKATELYCKSHELIFSKTPEKDFKSMMQGVLGPKGNVHFSFCNKIEEINSGDQLNSNYNNTLKNLAQLIDYQIHTNYKLWKSNYIAHDILLHSKQFSDLYSPSEKEAFISYIEERTKEISSNFNKPDFQNILITMYANPAINYLKSLS